MFKAAFSPMFSSNGFLPPPGRAFSENGHFVADRTTRLVKCRSCVSCSINRQMTVTSSRRSRIWRIMA